MQHALQISLRGLQPSPAIEARIRELATRLSRFADQITSCHVTLQAPHRHHQQGQRYEVRIRIGVPRAELVVTRQGSHDPAHEDAYVAIRDAFEAAARQLDERARRRERFTLLKGGAAE